jgi:hypothetical protein
VSILERIAHTFFLGCAVEVTTRKHVDDAAREHATNVLAFHDEGPFGDVARREFLAYAEQHDQGSLGIGLRAQRAAAIEWEQHAHSMVRAQFLDTLLLARFYGLDK